MKNIFNWTIGILIISFISLIGCKFNDNSKISFSSCVSQKQSLSDNSIHHCTEYKNKSKDLLLSAAQSCKNESSTSWVDKKCPGSYFSTCQLSGKTGSYQTYFYHPTSIISAFNICEYEKNGKYMSKYEDKPSLIKPRLVKPRILKPTLTPKPSTSLR